MIHESTCYSEKESELKNFMCSKKVPLVYWIVHSNLFELNSKMPFSSSSSSICAQVPPYLLPEFNALIWIFKLRFDSISQPLHSYPCLPISPAYTPARIRFMSFLWDKGTFVQSFFSDRISFVCTSIYALPTMDTYYITMNENPIPMGWATIVGPTYCKASIPTCN